MSSSCAASVFCDCHFLHHTYHTYHHLVKCQSVHIGVTPATLYLPDLLICPDISSKAGDCQPQHYSGEGQVSKHAGLEAFLPIFLPCVLRWNPPDRQDRTEKTQSLEVHKLDIKQVKWLARHRRYTTCLQVFAGQPNHGEETNQQIANELNELRYSDWNLRL